MIYIDTVMPNPVHRVAAGKSWNDREQIDEACKKGLYQLLVKYLLIVFTHRIYGMTMDQTLIKKKKKPRGHLYLKLEIISVMNSRISSL